MSTTESIPATPPRQPIVAPPGPPDPHPDAKELHHPAGVKKGALGMTGCRRARTLGLVVGLAAALALSACGGGTTSDKGPSVSPAPRLSSASTTAQTPGQGQTAQTPGIIQGTDNNNNPYGDFKVMLKVAPHLEEVDVWGKPYTPTSPVQPDGNCVSVNSFCEPTGYRYINFTLTFTNPTTGPEVFSRVGFTDGWPCCVFLAAPSSDGGTTPASAFGGPTNGLFPVTEKNRNSYWQPAGWSGLGIGSPFPGSFVNSAFFFHLDPSTITKCWPGNSFCAPDTLPPGESFTIEYGTEAVVAPTAPMSGLTVWVGVKPQQVRG